LPLKLSFNYLTNVRADSECRATRRQ